MSMRPFTTENEFKKHAEKVGFRVHTHKGVGFSLETKNHPRMEDRYGITHLKESGGHPAAFLLEDGGMWSGPSSKENPRQRLLRARMRVLERVITQTLDSVAGAYSNLDGDLEELHRRLLLLNDTLHDYLNV